MSSKKRNLSFIGGLAVAFLLPLSFYLVLKPLSEGKVHLPRHYFPESVDSQVVKGKIKYDTVYHKVADITLTNQLGHVVSLNKNLAGKILLIDFFFTNCPVTCPRMTHNMAMMQAAFKKDPKSETSLTNAVQFISITVNPARDSFPALRAYADHYGANHDRWWFLTGNKAAIYNYARNELHVAVQPGDGGDDDFIHTQKWVLLDQERNIRGYYDGIDSLDMKRCADDIVLLNFENKK